MSEYKLVKTREKEAGANVYEIRKDDKKVGWLFREYVKGNVWGSISGQGGYMWTIQLEEGYRLTGMGSFDTIKEAKARIQTIEAVPE